MNMHDGKLLTELARMVRSHSYCTVQFSELVAHSLLTYAAILDVLASAEGEQRRRVRIVMRALRENYEHLATHAAAGVSPPRSSLPAEWLASALEAFA